MRRQKNRTLSRGSTAEYVQFSVKDHGTGIPKDIQSKVFDSFFTTKKAGKGTGLGLGIIYKLIKEMHGEIWFESEEGVGTTFYLRFPRVEAEAINNSDEDEETSLEQNSEFKVEKSVLIVEDEEDIREILKYYLETLNCHVDEACNGIEALEKIKNNNYDCLFTDMKMPKMDGMTLLNEIQGQNCKPHCIVALTGAVNDNPKFDPKYCPSKIIDGYILKPFSQNDIASMIIELSKKKSRQAA